MLVTEVDDNLNSVRVAIEDFKAIIQEVDEEAWAVEVLNDKRRVGLSKGKAKR